MKIVEAEDGYMFFFTIIDDRVKVFSETIKGGMRQINDIANERIKSMEDFRKCHHSNVIPFTRLGG